MTGIRQWTVRTPHGSYTHVHEAFSTAWAQATSCAESVAPSVVTGPDGTVFYVFREDKLVEVSTRHTAVGTTRRVVEPNLGAVAMTDAVMIAYGACIRCRRFVGFDPELVPSVSVHPETRCPIRPDGTQVKPNDPDAVREPLCVWCVRVFRAAGGKDKPLADLFPHARTSLIDVDAALRVQAARL